MGYFTHVDGTFATRDVARLEAPGKQRLWVVPSLKLVILRVGGDPGDELGRGDDSRQHHPRNERMAAVANDRSERSEELRAALSFGGAGEEF